MTILPQKKQGKEGRNGSQQQQQASGSSARPAPNQRSFAVGRRSRGAFSSVVNSGAQSSSSHNAQNPGSPDNSDQEHNSDDEHRKIRRIAPSQEVEDRFEQHLKRARGFTIKKMYGDGACLFRAVADQIYGDQEMHSTVRKLCMDYMSKNSDHFSQFVTEDIGTYIVRKRLEHVHGNNVEMGAMAEMFNRPIEVYEYSINPINTFQCEAGADNPPIRVSYHGTCHYNSVVDPWATNIGVGLGFPHLQPGMPDKKLLKEGIKISENEAIESTMLKDKIQATDWEATDSELTDQIAKESYLQWLHEQERLLASDSKHLSSGGSCSDIPSGIGTTVYQFGNGKRVKPQRGTPPLLDDKQPSTSEICLPSTSTSRPACDNKIAPSIEESDDIAVLNRVMEISRQEYLESLKNKKDGKDD